MLLRHQFAAFDDMPQRPSTLSFRSTAPAIRPRERRPSSTSRGYGSSWQKTAALHLARNPLCVRCSDLANLVDHIHPVLGPADTGFFDPANHQSLCRRCHAVKTHADRRAGLTRKA